MSFNDELKIQDTEWEGKSRKNFIVDACNGKLDIFKLRADLWATSKLLYKVSLEIKDKAKTHFPC